MLLQLASPANNARGPGYMEKALAAIHQNWHRDAALTLSVASNAESIGLFIACPDESRESIVGPIIANYPQCSITAVTQTEAPDTVHEWSLDVDLVREVLPILRYTQFEDQLNREFADPVSSLLRAVKPDEGLECGMEIRCRPASHSRYHNALKAVICLEREFFRRHHRLAGYYARNATRGRWRFIAKLLGLVAMQTGIRPHTTLETSPGRTHDREEILQAAAHKLGCHLFDAQIRIVVRATSGNKTAAAKKLKLIVASLGPFTRAGLAVFRGSSITLRQKATGRRPSFLLSHEELATLWHPPTATTVAEKMVHNEFVELEAPAIIHSEKERGSVVLGTVNFRDDQRPVVLGPEDRRRHLYIVGKTGMGKTSLIQNMLAADLNAGRGICLIDPHGDLAESVVGLMPSHRTNEVILLDAADREIPIPFNPLACPDPSRVDQVTSGVISSFKRLNESWGPRLEDTLRNAIFAVVEQGGDLLSVMRLLGEKQFREQIVMRIRDDVVRSFWIYEFAGWSDNYRTEAVAAILNKIRPFITNSLVRNIVNHPGKSLDLRQVMDDGKVLIVNLSKGRLGEDNATLLGAFLVTSLQQAAMTRANIPEAGRRDFTVYIDEFQVFLSTSSFAACLSESRKFRLNLVLAHQYLGQLDDETADAVWGNVGSIVAFQVGAHDAEALAAELGKFAGQIAVENLTGLPKYAAYARLLIDGMPSRPFSMRTNPPAKSIDPNRTTIVKRLMARKFGVRPVHQETQVECPVVASGDLPPRLSKHTTTTSTMVGAG